MAFRERNPNALGALHNSDQKWSKVTCKTESRAVGRPRPMLSKENIVPNDRGMRQSDYIRSPRKDLSSNILITSNTEQESFLIETGDSSSVFNTSQGRPTLSLPTSSLSKLKKNTGDDTVKTYSPGKQFGSIHEGKRAPVFNLSTIKGTSMMGTFIVQI
jgi:hypothetical protein